jgi:hypothetical protein
MENILSSLRVFAYLKDFIISFDRGEESGEREIYTLPCVYREFWSKKIWLWYAGAPISDANVKSKY